MKTFLLTLCVAIGGGVGYKYRDNFLNTEDKAPEIKKAAVSQTSEEEEKFNKARQAVVEDNVEEAEKLYLELIESESNKRQAVKALSALYENKGWERKSLTLQFENAENDKQREEIYTKITKLTERTMNSKDSDFEGMRYIIKIGDNLAKIARKYGSTPRLLQLVNGIKDPSRIRQGQAIKVVPFKPFIKVIKEERKLYLYNDGELFRVYRVGIGKETCETPTRRFKIDVMQIDPPWYKPTENGVVVVPGKHKDNALGSRWMSFDGEYSSFGIHGTNAPETVGTKCSNGCVRLLNEEVNELFVFVRRGTEVEIIEKRN